MKRVSIFDEIDLLDAQRFRGLRKELNEHDAFFAMMGTPSLVSDADKETLKSIYLKYGIEIPNVKENAEVLENASWAVMSRSTLLK